MKKLFLFLSLAIFIGANAQTSTYDALLKKYVSKNGNVNYKGFKTDASKLDSYLDYLATTKPQKSWSAAKTKAFWANAYNAYTIKLIIDNYPLKSIMSIKEKGKDAWNIPFAKVGGKTYTLNHIEHEILRKNYNDPKIHVAVNCASISCPQLGNFAFTEANYEAKTASLMRKFVNDSNRNKITPSKVQLSQIFSWFKGDFTKKGDIVEFLNQYSDTKINPDAKLKHLTYNWNLNGK